MSVLRRLEIRLCAPDDLDALERALPSPGRSHFHRRRLLEQLSRTASYLVGWLDGVPVGHVNLRDRSGEPFVRARLGAVPELNALAVTAALGRRGIGTALVLDAERRAAAAGHALIGLAVNVDNHGARRLYDRLGYAEWPHGELDLSWSAVDDSGAEVLERERCAYLVKPLIPAP